jgi:hypothetical protein
LTKPKNAAGSGMSRAHAPLIEPEVAVDEPEVTLEKREETPTPAERADPYEQAGSAQSSAPASCGWIHRSAVGARNANADPPSDRRT